MARNYEHIYSEVERFARGCHLDPPRLEILFPGFHLGELGTNQRPKSVLIFEELTIVEEFLIADEHVGEFLQSFKSRICRHNLSLLLCRLSCKVETKWRLVRNFGRDFGTWEFGEWSLTTPNPGQSFERGATLNLQLSLRRR